MGNGELVKISRNLMREEWEEDFVIPKNRKVGVFGIAEGVGTSFVALGLGWQLSRNPELGVGFVDASGYFDQQFSRVPKPSLFDALGMEKRFAMKVFKDIFKMTEGGENCRNCINVDERINWAVPRGKTHWDYSEKDLERDDRVREIVRLVANNLNCDICICDFGSHGNEIDLEEFMREIDSAIIVADPRPSRLLAGEERLLTLKKLAKACKVETHFVLNRVSDGAPLHEVKRFLGERNVICLDGVEEELMCVAEYGCKIPFSMKLIREELEEEVKLLARKII